MPDTSEELIQAAMDEVGPGATQAATARKRRSSNQPLNNSNSTPACLSRKHRLSSHQERFIARRCLEEHEAGRTPRRADIQDLAQRTLNQNRKNYLRLAPHPLGEESSRPPRLLSEHWVDRFLKRYPAVKKVMHNPTAILTEAELPKTPPPESDEEDADIPTPENSRHLREIIRGFAEPLPRDMRVLFRNMGKLMDEQRAKMDELLAEGDRLRMEIENAKAEEGLEEDEDLELEEGIKTEADVADIKVEEAL